MLFTTHFPPCRLHVLRSISSMPVSLKGPTTHYQHSHPPIFLLLQSTICPLTLHKLHQSPITPATALLPPFTLHTQHQPHNTPSPNSLQHQPPSTPAATPLHYTHPTHLPPLTPHTWHTTLPTAPLVIVTQQSITSPA